MPRRRCHGCHRNAANESGLCRDCTKALRGVADDLRRLANGLEEVPEEELNEEKRPDYVF